MEGKDMKLWIGNIAPGTSDDEIKELLKKYSAQLECSTIEHVEGDGSRPAAMIEFSKGSTSALENLRLRLNGMYWKGRALVCSTMRF